MGPTAIVVFLFLLTAALLFYEPKRAPRQRAGPSSSGTGQEGDGSGASG